MLQCSYVVRFWRSQPCESWRATLIRVDAEVVEQHFTTAQDLLAYLGCAYPALPEPAADVPPSAQEQVPTA